MNRSAGRMSAVKLIAFMMALAALGGCGEDATPDPPDEGPLLEYSRSGGFAFSIDEVTIDSDGSGVARFGSDLGNLEKKTFELSEAQLDELRTTLEENPIPDIDKGDSACADCFAYEYAYGGDEIYFDQVSVPEELEPVQRMIAGLPLPEDGPTGG